jgi:hypothetical protein
MSKNQYVSMANIDAICFVLNCEISDIIEYIENGNPKDNIVNDNKNIENDWQKAAKHDILIIS